MYKKAQVVVPIIIGSLIVFGLIVYFVFAGINTKQELLAGQVIAYDKESQLVRTFMEGVLAEVSKDALIQMGKQGGYVKVQNGYDQENLLSNGNYAHYPQGNFYDVNEGDGDVKPSDLLIWSDGEPALSQSGIFYPRPQDLERVLENYIGLTFIEHLDYKLRTSVDFRQEGYELNYSIIGSEHLEAADWSWDKIKNEYNIYVDVSINLDTVDVQLEYPVYLEKEGGISYVYNYAVQIPVRLGRIVGVDSDEPYPGMLGSLTTLSSQIDAIEFIEGQAGDPILKTGNVLSCRGLYDHYESLGVEGINIVRYNSDNPAHTPLFQVTLEDKNIQHGQHFTKVTIKDQYNEISKLNEHSINGRRVTGQNKRAFLSHSQDPYEFIIVLPVGTDESTCP